MTYKAVSVHNFPGKYSQRGYPASGIFGLKTINNAIDAEFSWWPLGDYQESVRDGKQEVVGYVRDEIQRCPEQQVVLGGYSQGAQVMGESVLELSSEERSHIAGMALFGDPKFTASEYSQLKFWEKPKPYPWKRGTAGDKERGLADARTPYVPDDMRTKTISWCFQDDFVCTGHSGISHLDPFAVRSLTDLGLGHVRYASLGAPQAASEIVQKMSPILYSLEKTKGGIDKDKGAQQAVPKTAVSKPIDVMFLVNTSAGVDDVIWTLRNQTHNVLNPFEQFYENINYGVMDFKETQSGEVFTPYVAFRRDLYPLRIFDNDNDMAVTFVNNLANGSLSGGGADAPDPHGVAIERAVMRSSWRPEAKKHLVLITPRPPKQTYTYAVCNNSASATMSGMNSALCRGSSPASGLSSLYPELCASLLQILGQTTCSHDDAGGKPLTRKIQDAIALAQAKNIAIDVIVPRQVVYTDTRQTQENALQQLREFATGTGGLFIHYDSFTRANYTDMMWNILNHNPQQLQMTSMTVADAAHPSTDMKMQPQQVVRAKTNTQTVFDVSQGQVLAAQVYKWDFDNDGAWDRETASPNMEHNFTEPFTGLMRVSAFMGAQQQASLTLPIEVTVSSGGPSAPAQPPVLPSGIQAIRKSDGTVVLTWEPTGNDVSVLFVGDVASGLPIRAEPTLDGRMEILNWPADMGTAAVWVAHNDGISERATIEIVLEPSVAVENDSNVPVSADGNPQPGGGTQGLPDKLQPSESAPWSQYTPANSQEHTPVLGASNLQQLPDQGQLQAIVSAPTSTIISVNSDESLDRSYLPNNSQPSQVLAAHTPSKKQKTNMVPLVLGVVTVVGLLAGVVWKLWRLNGTRKAGQI